jgi:hypothetical protein
MRQRDDHGATVTTSPAGMSVLRRHRERRLRRHLGRRATAKHFILMVRTEVTDRMLIFGERHLRRVLAEYARPLQRAAAAPGAAAAAAAPNIASSRVHGRIRRRPLLGGLTNEYEMAV